MTQKSAATKTFPVFDGDSHIVEPPAIWERYLEPEYRVAARSAFWRAEGEVAPVTVLNGRVVAEPYVTPEPVAPLPMRPGHPVAHVNIPRYGVWHPGMTTKDIGSLDPRTRHPVNPGASDPQARLKDMDLMGIDQALIFPTWFAEYFPLVQNPDVAAALARAYNNWVLDFCKVAPARLIPAAVLPVQEINAAVKELRRAAKLGFKAAFIRPLFIQGRYPSHPYYYPLWRELEELGVLYCSHPMVGTTAPEMDCHSPFIERVSAHFGTGHPVAEAMAGVMDNGVLLGAMVGEGLLEKFPRIRFYFVHSKASWVHLYLEKFEAYLWLSIQAEPVSLEPGETFFSRSVLINFDSSESAIWEMPDLYEGSGAWGSFYPNHDTYTAWESIETLTGHGVPSGTVRKLMGGNLAKVLGVEAVLQTQTRR